MDKDLKTFAAFVILLSVFIVLTSPVNINKALTGLARNGVIDDSIAEDYNAWLTGIDYKEAQTNGKK